MFGLSFTEIMVLLIVGIVVVGPRKLPNLMRTAGQWISKIRSMSRELRDQAGINDIIRQEGLEKELRELRALSRTNVLETLVNSADLAGNRALPKAGASAADKASATNAGAAKAGTSTAKLGAPAGAVASAPPGAVAQSSSTAARVVSGPPPSAGTPSPSLVNPALAIAARLDPPRDREYPLLGCDSYGALPDDIDDAELDEHDPDGPALDVQDPEGTSAASAAASEAEA